MRKLGLRSVTVETSMTVHEMGQDRAVIVTLRAPGVIELRLKGTRRRYVIRADAAYWVAVKSA